MSITFRGVFAESLGGFFTVRGYAKLSELAQWSQADAAYQRELKPKHQQEISDFYQRGDYLFFPEIVLSLALRADYDKEDKPREAPMRLIRQGEKFRSNLNGVEVASTRTRSSSDLARVNITLRTEGEKPLKRIDGNHRLAAFEAIAADPANDRLAPFCIILFAQNDAPRNEKALFFNINSKALPLTSEEVYKGIIDNAADFPDDVLERDFGQEFVLCRQLLPQLDFRYLNHLKELFGQSTHNADCRRSVFIEALQAHRKLNDGQLLPSADDLFSAVRTVNNFYADFRLQTTTSAGLFAAFLHLALNTGNLPKLFQNWVLKNHLYELQAINPVDLIRIFEKIAQSKRHQIFVSMQFSTDTQPNFDAIKAVVDDVNAAYRLNIRLREIRIDQFDTGFSYEINGEILQLIEECGLLIADLTLGNKNVYHEIGFLMGLNQGKKLPQENFILLHNDSIGTAKDDIAFNLANIKQIRVKDTNGLRQDIKKQIEIFYGLSRQTA